MSLIDRYTGNYVPVYCERCGAPIPENEGAVFAGCDVCDDCWHYAYSNAAMADFAVQYAGSWYTFLKECVLGAGDMYWSEIVELARNYFDKDFEDFVMNKKEKPHGGTAPLKERKIAI